MSRKFLLGMMLVIVGSIAKASGSHIGNGDDGIDLENSKKINSGI